MNPSPQNAPSSRRIATIADAQALVVDVVAALDAIDETLAKETELMGGGRVNDALSLAAVKQERSGAYMRLLESVKANGVALARFAPSGIDALKERHAAFMQRLKLNQTVIATVRAVSETLMRDLQQEATSSQRLSVYGPGAAAKAQPVATPLALSVRL